MELGDEYADDEDSDLNEIQLLPFKKELFAMPADTVTITKERKIDRLSSQFYSFGAMKV